MRANTSGSMSGGIVLRQKWSLVLCLCVLSLFLTACSLSKRLPSGNSTLVGQITAKEDKLLTITVVNQDHHYDTGTQLAIKYHSIHGGTSLETGDFVQVTYDYLTDVTVEGKLPCITLDTVTKTQWVPPTTAEMEPARESEEFTKETP